jgi:hypothetical protein
VHKYKNIVSNNKTDAVAVEEKRKNVGRELQKNSILNPLMVFYH